jgi:hypothetical protein
MCIVTAACFGLFIGHLQVIKVKGKVRPGGGHESPGESRGYSSMQYYLRARVLRKVLPNDHLYTRPKHVAVIIYKRKNTVMLMGENRNIS